MRDDAFSLWYSAHCRMIIPAEDEIKSLMRRAFEAGVQVQDDVRQGVVGQARVDLIERVGKLWRGDWSGHSFDGRDGQGWIHTALHGNADALRALNAELHKLEAD
jgi:hypothetical protein